MTNDSARHWVFCYGSNSIRQLEERTGARGLQAVAAQLHDHIRIFCGRSSKWQNGSVASVFPYFGGVVHGTLVELSMAQILILDTYEGTPTVYTREVRAVHIKGAADPVLAYVYIMTQPLNTEMLAPSLQYMRAIRANLDQVSSDSTRQQLLIRYVVQLGLHQVVKAAAQYDHETDAIQELYTAEQEHAEFERVAATPAPGVSMLCD